MKQFLLTVFFVIATGTISSAQQTVTGNVSDVDGNYISDVIVTVKGTETKSKTDSIGSYIINIPLNYKTLSFQKPGFQVTAVTVDRKVINIVMIKSGVDIFDLTLEELLSLKITTATKSNVKISEAPAIVSVITSEEIDKKGFLSVPEAIVSIEGVNSVETYWGFNQIFFRGIYSTLYNDKSLVLINGHPFWGAVNSSHYIETFPVEAIKRIEVIRGPGSTLYGTNAYAGVINIITKTNDTDKIKSSAFVRNANLNNTAASVSINHNINDLNFNCTVQGQYSDGYDFTLPQVEGGLTNVPYSHINNYISTYTNISYKGLSIDNYSFFQNKSKIDAAPFAWGSLNQTDNIFRGYFYGLSYNFLDNDVWNINIRASYNTILRKFKSRYALNHAYYQSDGSRADAEFNINRTINKSISVLAGLLYENVNVKYYNFLDANTDTVIAYGFGENTRKDYILSGFFLFFIKLGDKVNLIAGVRYSFNEHYGNIFTPRGGFVFKITKNINSKILYGNAFRAPNLFEKYWAFGTTFGSEDLTPEGINTFEFAVDYTKNNFSSKVNYFYNISSDLIGRELQADNTTKYVNLSGKSTTQGFETEIRYRNNNLDAFLKGAYLIPLDTGKKEIKYIPKIMFNIGAMYSYKRFSAYISLNYLHKVINTVNAIEEKIPALLTLNAKLNFKLTDKLTLSVIGKNLSDEEIWAPEFIRRNIIKLPNGYGRLLMLELRLKI